MQRLVVFAAFALTGLVAGYFAGVAAFCPGESPGNLCGLPTAVTAPLGCYIGVKLFRLFFGTYV